MPCFHPLRGWPSRRVNPSGKRSLTFSEAQGYGSPVDVPCGQCIGCRLERARQWSVRLMHEAQFYEETSFLTLTYSEEHLPSDGSVSVRPLQLFLKRLRRAFAPQRLRFFACGEYGERLERPHYHVVLFGESFLFDRKRYKVSGSGDVVYTSPTLDRLWGLGQCWIGTLTLQSAGYVARYCVKKVGGDLAKAHYGGRKPEFMICSKGLGREWFDNFRSDVYPDDFVVFKGKRMRVPRYYDKMLPEHELAELKAKRIERLEANSENNTPDRLAVREEVTKARISTLKRGSP